MSNSPGGSTHSSSGRENPTGYSSSTQSKRRSSKDSPMAFYEIPAWVENVPSKIINNAKQSLKDMPTSRPYTPRDDSRYTLTKLNYDTTSFNPTSTDYETESRPTSSKIVDIKRRNSKGSIAGISDSSAVVATQPPARLSKLNHQPSQDQVRSDDGNISSQTKPPLPSNHQRSNAVSTASTSTISSSTPKSSHHRISSSSTKDDSSEENLIWKHEIGPLIETLITAYQKNHFEQFDQTCNDLYNSLLKHNLFGKKSNKKRGELLKTLFGFIESENPIVRFHVARLSLAFQISSSNNLRHIIRITADLTTKKTNDHIFLNTNILDLLLETISRVDVEQNLESIAYFSTILQNLTVNNELICFISEKKPFELIKRILKTLLQLKDQPQLLSKLCDCLVPLTSALRNLADNDLNRQEYLSDDLIDHLTFILKYFTDKSHEDLMKNVARLFSKLTQHTDCCMKLVQCSSCYRSFLKILIKHEIVRICFILGNMMAKSEDARLTFMKDSHALQTLTKLLHSYIQLDSLVLKPDKLDNNDSISQDIDIIDDPNTNQFR
ncbi:unnamed protein product [Rotaria sp. Silwood2]|nr:unnamed protein product [Rotaria sp. Silwood2]